MPDASSAMETRSRFRALVFDFDGLVLDTETCVYESWRAVYAEHGCELPLDRWCEAIGSTVDLFDPFEDLRARVGARLDAEQMQERRRRHRDALLAELEPMPGVGAWLRDARARGLGLGLASSSDRLWVESHLKRLELRHFFDAVATEDDVAAVKPAPDLYLHATAALQVEPGEAVAIEDSPNGVAAAVAAGLRCIAVPGPMTRHLDFGGADLVVDSLADRPLVDLIGDLPPRSVSAAKSPGAGA
jgi:HAD superfamily hydrolase (TIGR01509 family)